MAIKPIKDPQFKFIYKWNDCFFTFIVIYVRSIKTALFQRLLYLREKVYSVAGKRGWSRNDLKGGFEY